MRRVALVAVAAVLALCACGGASEAESARRDQVEEIRLAAEAGDMEGARAAVAQLQSLVEGQLADGEIDPGEAARVLAAARGVESALGPPPTEATTTTTTTTTAPPPPPEDDDKDDKDRDDEKGKGKGKGGGRGKGDD